MKMRTGKLLRLNRTALRRLKQAFLRNATPDSLIPNFLSAPAGDASGAKAPLSENEKYWHECCGFVIEVLSCLERLEQSVAYLGLRNNGKILASLGLSESEWMRYHIEMWLHETYMLNKRLLKFLEVMKTKTARWNDQKSLAALAEQNSVVRAAFKKTVDLRGAHVHAERFDDRQFRDLFLLNELITVGHLNMLRAIQKSFRRKVATKWHERLKRNNKQIVKLCEHVFETVRVILLKHEPPRSAVQRPANGT
jgi:hypothetical protein